MIFVAYRENDLFRKYLPKVLEGLPIVGTFVIPEGTRIRHSRSRFPFAEKHPLDFRCNGDTVKAQLNSYQERGESTGSTTHRQPIGNDMVLHPARKGKIKGRIKPIMIPALRQGFAI